MRYYSTRDKTLDFSFQESILKGYGPEGSLLLPVTIPQVTTSTLESWINLSYSDVVFEVTKLFVDPIEIPHCDLKNLIKRSFNNFPAETVRIANVGDGSLKVAELFHGPTMAFKDLSVSCLAQFMDYFLKKTGKKAIVTVATSGDTGGSVVHSFKGMNTMDVLVMYPKGRCNEIQDLQMSGTSEKNIHCFEVEGTSDDEDFVMTTVHSDIDFAKTHNLTVANSINWGRMIVQVANFFYVYLKSGVAIGNRLKVIVPTGAAGNATGGCIAYRMGLPIHLCLATNSNDYLHQFFQQGLLTAPNEPVKKTLAPAMDIQVPYNLERILTIFAEGVTPKVDLIPLLKNFNEKDLKIPKRLLAEVKEVIIESYAVDDIKIMATIRKCWNENNYAVCPHTATAVACFYDMTSKDNKDAETMVVIATASPQKFPEVLKAAGIPYEEKDLQLLRLQKQKNSGRHNSMLKGQDWVKMLREKIQELSARREDKRDTC